MHRPAKRSWLVALWGCGLVAAAGADPPPARIAITVDDLPWLQQAGRSGGELEATERILSALKEQGAPATGFVVCDRIGEHEPTLRRWLDDGMTLGNHSAGHRDLNRAEIELWLDDVRRCDQRLRAIVGRPVRFFRFPMLHQGATIEKRDAALALLERLDYRIAHVSVDNSDWILGRAYAGALARGDAAAQASIGRRFVAHILDAVRHYQGIARSKLGRDLDHVLLLHATELVADHLTALLEELSRAGFEFISLEEALREPAYHLPDGYLGPKGLSWLYRMAPATPEGAAWDDQQAQLIGGQVM
ncbi:MAG TPA: polysaccharide deacetylase family protein [Acidobacteriota bacterium]